jgi:16S rRNA G966 N2-methylase RsmD
MACRLRSPAHETAASYERATNLVQSTTFNCLAAYIHDTHIFSAFFALSRYAHISAFSDINRVIYSVLSCAYNRLVVNSYIFVSGWS